MVEAKRDSTSETVSPLVVTWGGSGAACHLSPEDKVRTVHGTHSALRGELGPCAHTGLPEVQSCVQFHTHKPLSERLIVEGYFWEVYFILLKGIISEKCGFKCATLIEILGPQIEPFTNGMPFLKWHFAV